MNSMDLAAFGALKATTCVCGNVKRRGFSFCGTCYFSLPPSVQSDLRKPLGQGYTEAFDRACQMLVDLRAEEAEPESTL